MLLITIFYDSLTIMYILCNFMLTILIFENKQSTSINNNLKYNKKNIFELNSFLIDLLFNYLH